MRRAVLVAAVAVAAAALFAVGARAAAPRIVMVTGAPLRSPIFLTNWWENLRLMAAVAEGPRAPASAVAGRRRPLALSLFWGPIWVDYVNAGRPLSALRPRDAEQQLSFFPAVCRRAPVVVGLANGVRAPRRATSTFLGILRLHAVPTRMPCTGANARRRTA